MIRTILVPLDGSEFGEHALPLAASLARHHGAALHLVHVHQPAPRPAAEFGYELIDLYDVHLREDEEAYLADVKRRLAEAAGVTAVTKLIGAVDIANTLREYAAATAAECVVMTTHGRGALSRWWFGSVTDELTRTMTRPVLTVRPAEDGKADLKRRPELKSIVVALDGTELAVKALDPAMRLAEPFGATISLVRVCPPALRASYLPDGTTIAGLTHTALDEIASAQRRAELECQDYLREVAQKVAERCLPWTTHVPIEEEPAEGILAVARARHADLIAIETHGRGGLSRLVMGSVADKVIRGGEVPVLLNRPAEIGG